MPEVWSSTDYSEIREHEPTHTISEFVKATLFMNKEHVKPSASFQTEVYQALGLEDSIAIRAKLMEIAERYGPFWARKIQLGGRITKREFEGDTRMTRSNHNQVIGMEIVIGGNVDLYMDDRDSGSQIHNVSLSYNL